MSRFIRSGTRNTDSVWQCRAWVRVCAHLPVWLAGLLLLFSVYVLLSNQRQVAVVGRASELCCPLLAKSHRGKKRLPLPLGLHQFLKMTAIRLSCVSWTVTGNLTRDDMCRKTNKQTNKLPPSKMPKVFEMTRTLRRAKHSNRNHTQQ